MFYFPSPNHNQNKPTNLGLTRNVSADHCHIHVIWKGDVNPVDPSLIYSDLGCVPNINRCHRTSRNKGNISQSFQMYCEHLRNKMNMRFLRESK